METIYEQRMESPVMITSGHQKFKVHGRNLANTGKPMAPVSPLSPADSSSSQSPTSPSLAKRPSQMMRDWVKRSGSGSGSGRPTKHVAPSSVPGHQRLPIVHLGGGRLGESDIEPAFSTGLRPMARNPSTQRESSADSRVTQWIDLYPEAIERMHGYDARLTQGRHARTVSESSSTIKQTRWKFLPDHHALAPPEIDARPAPLRIPSAKKRAVDDGALKGPTTGKTTTLARSDSKWKPLPILPAQQVVQKVPGNPTGGGGIPARKPLQPPPVEATQSLETCDPADTTNRPQTPKQRQRQTDQVLIKKPNSIPPLPLAIYVTPPPTPDSETEPIPEIETASGPPALRIDTGAGNPSPPSTSSVVPKPQVTFELAATEPTTLRASLASPLTTTTQSDSILSADLDDAFKITIGMMCLNQLDLRLGGAESGGSGGMSASQAHQPQSRPELAEQHSSKGEPLGTYSSAADLDSPLAYVPRLFSPRGGSPVGGMFPSSLARDPAVKSPSAGSIQNNSGSTEKETQEQRSDVVVAARLRSLDGANMVSPFLSTATATGTSTIQGAAAAASSSSSNTGSQITPLPPSALTVKSSSPIHPRTARDESKTPTRAPSTTTPTPAPTPAPAPSTTSRYTRAERTWLHQHYRGEAPFLRAWGLDIKNPADRDEGMLILQELIISEI